MKKVKPAVQRRPAASDDAGSSNDPETAPCRKNADQVSLKKRISGMITWAKSQENRKGASDDEKAAARNLLTDYQLCCRVSESGKPAMTREEFVSKFEASKSSKQFSWSKDFLASREEITRDQSKSVGKYCTRIGFNIYCNMYSQPISVKFSYHGGSFDQSIVGIPLGRPIQVCVLG